MNTLSTDSPKITILMPCLNVSKYIRQCIESIISQTLKDIEIIVIDAGSEDGTLEILQEYAQKDTRIKILHSDRKSYGYQMNLGLSAAGGEYIGIVETDDWAEPNMFERLYRTAKTYDADMVKSNHYLYYSHNGERNEFIEVLAGFPYDEIMNAWQNNGRFFRLTSSIWSGIYRRSTLEQFEIRFNETPGASYQDTSFFLMICAMFQKIVLIRDAFLHYRQDNENSSVKSENKIYCICDEMRYFENYVDHHISDKTTLYKYYLPLKYDRYLWNYNRIAKQFQFRFLLQFRREFAGHQKDGLLFKDNFDDTTWPLLQKLIRQPLRYYLLTCKTGSLLNSARSAYFKFRETQGN